MNRELPAAVASLPIAPRLGEIVDVLGEAGALVLEAPPGAGKSTGVPLALLDAPWLRGQQILMLEPRRLAARAIATRMAGLLDEPVGQRVGYRTRLDTRVSQGTRLTVLTEGVLTRMLQSDPALEDVALVIFDEFHERSLNADLGLALCLDARANLRDDLKLLVMSATLDTAPVAALLGDAPTVSSQGQAFPVETRHVPAPDPRARESTVARVVRLALEREEGDVLVFLPGAREIRRVARALEDPRLPPGVDVFPLYGDLPPSAQDAALARSGPGRRKVVLATAIAETSLTIEGVRVVVDAGLARTARFDPVTGMSGLVTTRVSRAAADQRRGRAGRLGPGVCYRLWPEEESRGLEPATPPEILHADLAALALDMAAWGVANTGSLHFLDPPPAPHLAQAHNLLRRLGAIGPDDRITENGRRMAALGAHPRLAHMLLAGRRLGAVELACDLAALLSERDLLRGRAAQQDADLRLRVELLHGATSIPADGEVDRGACARALRLSRQWRRELGGVAGPPRDLAPAGALLAHAYPDRIGMRRTDGRYLLSGGRGAFFRESQSLSQCEFVVAAELDTGEREACVFLGAPLSREDIETHLAGLVSEMELVGWDDTEQAVIARRERRLGALCIAEARLPAPDAGLVRAALLEGLGRLGLDALPWTPAARSFCQRAEFVRRHVHPEDPGWPPCDGHALGTTLAAWLEPWLDGITRRSQLARLDLRAILTARFTHAQLREIDQLAPTHLVVPSGSRVAIDYGDVDAPCIAVRLQEVFGMMTTPRIAGGRVPLTLSLLSPAQRPVQVTRDLGSFWARGYTEVRKELKGRYPKHYWPDDPLTATPTRRVRPK